MLLYCFKSTRYEKNNSLFFDCTYDFTLFGFFSESIIGLTGMFYLMLSHGITSSGLFIGIGVLYDRYKTRFIFYYIL